MKSLSEIDTTSKRASKAIGFSWGEAEEIGKSLRLLELFGFGSIANFAHLGGLIGGIIYATILNIVNLKT